ncbi:hypothetical protein HDU79_004286 [Rhizoclosmatium sp. JEL0117]|nr:hypothetical protein HDU79_004286 [Rhizoclosmatium sp. JEL0117]
MTTTNETTVDSDVRLEQLGYKSEFKREMGLLANIGLSLTAIGVLTGMSSAFGAGLFAGGPLGLFWGWNIVSIFMFLIALSQAEICSAFPTMGGLYFWTCKLVPEEYVPFWGYVTGNLYVWGMVFTGTAGNMATALFIASLYMLVNPDAGPLKNGTIVGICICVNIVNGTLNHIGMRAIGTISKINVWFTLVGTVVLVATLFAASPVKNPASFAFFDFENYTGSDNSGFVFMLGFLQAVYALEGSETSAQVSEEAQKAETNGPIAIYSSIIGSWFVGVIYLIALLFNVQSIPNIAGTSYPIQIVQLFYDACGQKLAILCVCIILFAQWAAALTAFTASSRLFFALARDNAFPFKEFFMTLSKGGRVPYRGVWFSVVIASLVHCTYLANAMYFNSIISCAATGVLLSYSMPMICRVIWPGILNDSNRGPFSLGKYSYAVNLAGAAFCVVMSVFFVMPTSFPVTSMNINYAIAGIGLVLTLVIISFFVWGKGRFVGPVRTVDISVDDLVDLDKKAIA